MRTHLKAWGAGDLGRDRTVKPDRKNLAESGESVSFFCEVPLEHFPVGSDRPDFFRSSPRKRGPQFFGQRTGCPRSRA